MNGIDVAADTQIEFGTFRFARRGVGLLRRGNDGKWMPADLGSRANAVFAALVARPGDLVTKQEIMSAVWPDTVVEDNNLTVQISALRRVLDAGRDGDSSIQTVAGRGYRFIADVIPVDEAPLAVAQTQRRQPSSPWESGVRLPNCRPFARSLLSSGPWPSFPDGSSRPDLTTTLPAEAVDRRQSMLILPFENSSDDKAQEALAARVTHEVKDRILSAPGGAVIVGGVRAYQGKAIDPRAIGRKYDVHFVLAGNVRRQDGQIMVAAVLYETATGGPVWGRQLDLSDGPGALKVAAQVIYECTYQKTIDLEAWHAMRYRPNNLDTRDLLAIVVSTPLSNPSRTNYLEKLSLVDCALALDPHYLRSWERRARLLVEFVLLGYSRDPATDLARATEAASRALSIDAHAQLSLRVKAAVLRACGDWAEAECVQRRVIDLIPPESFRHYELGFILMAQGRHAEALASLQTARQSAGGNNQVYWYDGEIAMAHLALGQFADALAAARLAIGEMPPDTGRSEELPRLALIAATSLTGDKEMADVHLRKFLASRRSWRSMAAIERWTPFAANSILLEGLTRAGMPPK